MNRIKKGDIVGRISHRKDIIFEVIKIIRVKNKQKIAILKGITERIEVDSPLEDLILIDKEVIEKNIRKVEKRINEKIEEQNKGKESRRIREYVTGKILHLDGDRKYSEKSLRYYQKTGVRAIVRNIPEYKQPRVAYNLLLYYKPDILVVTGHDGMIKKERGYNDIYNYRNSRYFIETVKEAKRYEKDTGREIVIFAGACQSYYEALIMAGANFASSPARILIDFLDPLVIAKKIATTDYLKFITIRDIEGELRDGNRGVGGIGANGKSRFVML